jgi:predicted DCC family thiol-disulfide oxidoreductase YuxK
MADSPSPPLAPQAPTVLFDGVCNLCNASVNFMIDRDPHGVLRFASLQSDAARELLVQRDFPTPTAEPESILLVENRRVYARSTAALKIARHLSGLWPLLAVLLVVPRPLRDVVYKWVARHRYTWFGKADACRVPTPELRERFLR